MKTYWKISGPSAAPNAPCLAFYKYDGSNLRFEWSKKRGWYKYGTRKRLFDHTDDEFGPAIQVFEETYADELEKVFTSKSFKKDHRGVQQAVVFCEFFGPHSFAGQHQPEDPKELVLFDVALHKKGIMLPRDFLDQFGHLKVPEVIYEGNFNRQLITDVMDGKYPVDEGVVAKGILLGKKKNPQHGLWMAKIKTRSWMDRLREKAETIKGLQQILKENEREQS
jgi:hypothetical protein